MIRLCGSDVRWIYVFRFRLFVFDGCPSVVWLLFFEGLVSCCYTHDHCALFAPSSCAARGAAQRGSPLTVVGRSRARACARHVDPDGISESYTLAANEGAKLCADLLYPAGGTQLCVRRWRDRIEARALERKYGLALNTKHTPMRRLSEAQRSANMQLQGLLLQSLHGAHVLRDRFIAQLHTLDDSENHGARMLSYHE